jgi:hypothetical protein
VELELMPDGTLQRIVVVHTDLELSSIEPDFDAKAWFELVEHIRAWSKLQTQKVLLRKI